MPKINNLLNQHFGNLTVLERTKSSAHGYYWLCQCKCGKKIEVLGTNLKSGNTKSCGCLKKNHQKNNPSHFLTLDLTNQKYGEWTVLYRTNKKGSNGNYYWHCKCSCGTEKDVLSGDLTSGKSKSCGCIKSFGEHKIAKILTLENIPFLKEYTFSDCLTENNHKCRFDFVIFDKYKNINAIIEFDGKQHYEESFFDLEKNQKRNKNKNEYCLSHQLPLYRIPYFEINNINTFSDIINKKYLVIQ